jgi:lipoprotein-anchoring transpeptidase ErfK/SrfK
MWNPQRERAVLAAMVSAAIVAGAAPAAASSDIGAIVTQPTRTPFSSTLALARKKTATKPDRKKADRADKTPEIPPGPLQIVVSINTQRVKLYANGREVAEAPVSTGTPSHPTPMGVFSIIQKNRHHVSNLYDASMPYMQRITWSGAAMHQGPLPGYPASHGCIRLPGDFAAMLWKATKIGARVVIAKEEIKPAEIEHPRLFVSKPKSLAEALRPLIKTADGSPTLSGAVVPDAAAVKPETTASGGETRPRADLIAPATPAAKPLADNRAILAEAAPSARDVQRRVSPVSVFVSRKDGRLYVRQAMEPLFDLPVAIQNPDQPIGTHVFTAMELKNDAMRWNAMSIPSSYSRHVTANLKSKKSKTDVPVQPTAEPLPSASAALDRLELTQDIRDQIGALLTPGSSLIISDHGIASGETGKYTDFIVLTR